MRRLNDRIAGPAPGEPEKPPRSMWPFFLLIFGLIAAVNWGGRWLPVAPVEPYESPTRIAGLPLLAMGEHPRGIIAFGNFPVGVIAIGGASVGLIAIGGVAIGGLALSGLSLGIFAIGGGAVGWWAFGGGAAGYYATGGGAAGAYAYSGNGVALGYCEAHGRQKEKLLG
jgi:hypothetical protein